MGVVLGVGLMDIGLMGVGLIGFGLIGVGLMGVGLMGIGQMDVGMMGVGLGVCNQLRSTTHILECCFTRELAPKTLCIEHAQPH